MIASRNVSRVLSWIYWVSSRRRSPLSTTRSQEACATENGPALRRIERYRCLLSALCALNRNLYALTNSRRLSRGNCGQPFVLCLLAAFTPLGLVLQSLVVKKDLFSSSPDEVFSAVNALDVAIVKLAIGFNLRTPGFFYLRLFNHDLLPWARSCVCSCSNTPGVLRNVRRIVRRPLSQTVRNQGFVIPGVAKCAMEKYNYVETVSRPRRLSEHLFWNYQVGAVKET